MFEIRCSWAARLPLSVGRRTLSFGKLTRNLSWNFCCVAEEGFESIGDVMPGLTHVSPFGNTNPYGPKRSRNQVCTPPLSA